MVNSCHKYFTNIYLLRYHCANCWRRHKSGMSWRGRWIYAVQFPKGFHDFEFVPLKYSSCRAFCKELSFPLKCNSTISVKWNSCKSYSSGFGCVEVCMAGCALRWEGASAFLLVLLLSIHWVHTKDSQTSVHSSSGVLGWQIEMTINISVKHGDCQINHYN